MTSIPMAASGYPLPAAEDERLAEAAAFGLLEGERPAGLATVCELARSIFGAAGAMVTAVGRDGVRVLASSGATPGDHDRKGAFCAWTLMDEAGLVVTDAAQDPRFASTGFYAGAPLLLRPGVALGAVAVLDPEPRDFEAADSVRLRLLADLALAELRGRRDLAARPRPSSDAAVGAEARIERLVYRDPLTDLPNRTLFQQTVRAAVDAASRRGGKVGLILLDLDHFKDVNDSVGHEAGDALLRSVASRLSVAYRKTDTVARLGGDEFAVILPSINGPDDLTRPTEKVMELLRRPLKHDGQTLSITASVGCAIYPEGEDDAAQLVKNAEIALFRAKATGRNRIIAFEPAMRLAVERRIELLREVREALSRGEFGLHYQPVAEMGVSGQAGRTVGFEALSRWSHPTRGLLTPDAFMAAFDDQELALQFGDAMLENALGQMRSWIDAGVAFGRIAVNLSAPQFRTGRLAETILDRLRHWGVPADRLCIEVTENVYMGWGAEVVGDAARILHAAGVQIALDDFGTGYASLTHLKSFPIDRLKIDRSFCQAEDDRAIVQAVATLAHSLGMQVVAEGVEDPAQLAALRDAGCDLSQGWWVGRPMPPADVPAHLVEGAKSRPNLRLA